MNEESQIRGCYNITFIYTPSGNSVGSPGNAHTKGRPASAGTLAERGRGGPSAQVLTLQIIRAIKFPPNQKRERTSGKKRLKGHGRGHTQCTRLHFFLSITCTLHTFLYSPLCFWSLSLQISRTRLSTVLFTQLFCLRSLYMECSSPFSPTETHSGLLQVKPQDISFSKTIDCHVFRSPSPLSQVSVGCLFKFL